MFAVSAKACCFSFGIGFKAAVAAVVGSDAADAMNVDDGDSLDFNCCDSCWDPDRGCCEVIAKVCCCYYELQCPPGKDIGIGCCGLRLCDNKDKEQAPEQQKMMEG